MSERVAVLNDTHSVAYRIMAFMLRDLGFTVYSAGPSFRNLTEFYKGPRNDPKTYAGVMEFKDMPQDALFVDHYPGCAPRLRAVGWKGPILLYWGLPVGPNWIEPNFHPGPRVGVYSQCPRIARCLREINRCPVEFFWPPYVDPIDRSPRTAFDPFVITVIQNTCGWMEESLLAGLRDDPEIRLEIYGGGTPSWARRMPHDDLLARMRRARCLFHPKFFDAPGRALMEAVLQGVPVVLPEVFLRKTEMTDIYEDGKSCLVVPSTVLQDVVSTLRSLSDREHNLSIGNEAQRRLAKASDYGVNKLAFASLIDRIYDGSHPGSGD